MSTAVSSGALDGAGLVLSTQHPRRALAAVFSQYLAVTYERLARLAPALPPALRAPHEAAVRALRALASADPRGTLSALAAPGVGAPVHCAALRDALPAQARAIDRAAARATPHALLELALRGALDGAGPLAWAAVPLASPSLGGALRPPRGARTLVFTGATLRARGPDGAPLEELSLRAVRAGERGASEPTNERFGYEPAYYPLGGVTHLALYDHNPIADFEAHPDKQGNALALGGRTVDAWRAALDEAFALVAAHLPSVYDEMKLLLREVIPVGYDAEKHLSASYREAIGTVYLTLHPQVLTLAEALVHEFQHNKLNAAAHRASFLENAFEPLYPSPVRPDPRPLWGILLAVHAFLPVAELYRALRSAGHPLARAPGFDRRLDEVDRKNHEGMSMLRAHGAFTAAGRALFVDLEALERAHLAERTAPLALAADDVHLA